MTNSGPRCTCSTFRNMKISCRHIAAVLYECRRSPSVEQRYKRQFFDVENVPSIDAKMSPAYRSTVDGQSGILNRFVDQVEGRIWLDFFPGWDNDFLNIRDPESTGQLSCIKHTTATLDKLLQVFLQLLVWIVTKGWWRNTWRHTDSDVWWCGSPIDSVLYHFREESCRLLYWTGTPVLHGVNHPIYFGRVGISESRVLRQFLCRALLLLSVVLGMLVCFV